jgi:DNA modification methylase
MFIEVGKVEMVALKNIEVGERAREVMGDLDEIESSMQSRGLISPLAVKENENGSYMLLAGERRYLVLQRNEVATVPVRVYPSDISQFEIKSIELAENMFRKDFEYWEYDNLVREVHSLQQEIHGAKAPGPGEGGWSTENTSNMLGISKGSVSTAISRANAREAFPQLFETCKTQKDASKLMDNMAESVVKEAIAKRIEANRDDSSLTQLAKRYIIKDFFEGVKDIPSEVIHLVEIDPPYAIDLKKAKKTDGVAIGTADYNEVDSLNYQVFLANTFKECYRVMTQNSWLLCWFAPEPWFEIVFRELQIAGFQSTRMCGIWTKGYGQSKRPEMHLANSYEMFFYAWKGRPALNKAGRSNEFEFSPIAAQNKTHPTERPVELMKEIYDTFAFPGSQVLIPFLGSGSGIIAAYELGMTATGFELSEGYRNSFLLRVNEMKIV